MESENQYEELLDMGCQLFQGNYFAESMPPEAFEKQDGTMEQGGGNHEKQTE